MSKPTVLWAVIVIVAICSSARADIQPLSGSMISDDTFVLDENWGQEFAYDSSTAATAGPIDLLAVELVDGGPFDLPVFRGLPSQQHWHLLWQTPAAASVGGDPVDTLSFELWFNSDPVEPLAIQLAAFASDGGMFPQQAFHAAWDGGEWAFSPSGWNITRAEAMGSHLPAPGAAVLGLIGLGLVGWVKQRFA